MSGVFGTVARVLGVAMYSLLSCICVAVADTENKRDSSLDLSCPGCNVIFLNIELLRADKVGLISGSEFTPNIDRFFRNSLVFRDVTAPAGETFLSNTAVLTVTPPHRLGIKAISIDRLDQQDVEARQDIRDQLLRLESIAEILGEAGYHNIGINQGGRAGGHAFLDRGFLDFGQWSSEVLLGDLTTLLADKLEKQYDSPLFVLFRPTFLHQHQYRRPTLPQSLADRNVRASEFRYSAPDGGTKRGVLLKRRRRAGPEAEKATEQSIYHAQLEYGDGELAQLFELLEAEYVENSIIVLYANHGSGLGDNGIFRHGTSFQASIRVPVLIRHPAVDRPIHVAEPVALLDLVPTVYRMLGVPWEGEPLIDTFDRILAGDAEGDRMLVGRNSWDEYVRVGHWKLIIQYDRIRSLFDLDQDPREEHNVYDSNTGVARRLESLLLDYKLRLQ